MGIFKKKHKADEDFILDFSPEAEKVAELPEEAAPGAPQDFELASWENRKHVTAPHAMTVGEILGSIDSEGDNMPEGGMKPRHGISAEDIKPEENKEPKPREEAEEKPKLQEEAKPSEPALPKEEPEAPLSWEPQKENEIEEEANELIARLKQKKSELLKQKEAEKELPKEEEKPHIPSASDPKLPQAPSIPEAAPVIAEAQKPQPKKETTLSPAAQALYDRMMAQRAKRQLSGETYEKAEKEEKLSVGILSAEKSAPSIIPEPEKDSDITPVYEDKTKESFENEEMLADSIFSSLKDTLKEENPLIRRKQTEGESLLEKCKNYVSPKSEITEESIDNIIHTAEKGARERLNNLYDVHDSEPIKTTASAFDFTRVIGENSNAVSVPVKIIDESADKAVISSHTGEIKNFQFSFADSEAPSSDATKIIDMKLGSAPQRADTAKIEAIRMHLDAMAYETDEVQLPKVKFTGSDETSSKDAVSPPQIADMDDYSSIEDKEGIKTDLSSKRVSLIARLLSTVAIFVALFIVNFLLKDSFIETSLMGFAIVNLALLGISMAINHNILKGLGSIFAGAPDMDSPAAISVTFSFCWGLITLLSGTSAVSPVLMPTAVLTLIFVNLGKLSVLSRISRGFEIIATPHEKQAVSFVEDKLDAAILANGAVVGEALITTGKATKNIKDFLKNSYSEDLYERSLRPIVLITLGVSLLFAILGFIFTGEFTGALTALSAATLLSCPASAILAANLPLSAAQKRLSEYDSMLAGHAGAEAIANANAAAFSASELFPEGTVKLYNMHVLNKGAVDKYLTAAAAVLGEAGSPLCPIFKEMLEDSKEELPKADSIKYESRMGVSGWIGEHRVFIGNRTLMEGHSIKVPSLELDKKILRGGYFPVYLAFDNQLCALFIVGYEADPLITYELRRLCSTGVTILINTNDPNITEEMLCDYFGLHNETVKLLSASGASAYKKNIAFIESTSAPGCYSGDICGFLSAITTAIGLKATIKGSLISQIVLSALALAAGGYMIASGLIGSLGAVVLGYQLLSGALSWLIAKFKQ